MTKQEFDQLLAASIATGAVTVTYCTTRKAKGSKTFGQKAGNSQGYVGASVPRGTKLR